MLLLNVTTNDIASEKTASELAVRIVLQASDQRGPDAGKAIGHAMAVGIAGIITAQHGPEAAIELFTKLLVNLVAAQEALGLHQPEGA